MDRRCCCKRRHGCLILEDNFNRPPSDDLGPNWDEKSGSWSINANRLHVAGVGLCRCTAPHPYNTPTAVAKCILFPSGNGSYNLKINVESDGSGGVAATVRVSDGSFYLSVGGGAEAGPSLWDTKIEFSICHNENGVYADAYGYVDNPFGVYHCVESPSSGGRYAALECDVESGADFDDFYYWQNYVTDPTCPKCWCECEGHCVPPALTGTFSGQAYSGYEAECDCLDGQEVSFSVWETSGISGDKRSCAWRTTDTTPLCYNCEGTHPWDMVFSLDSDDPGNSTLSAKMPETIYPECVGNRAWGSAEPISGYDYGAAPYSWSCDPFNFVFGPFVFHANDPGPTEYCGEYYIIITEQAA